MEIDKQKTVSFSGHRILEASGQPSLFNTDFNPSVTFDSGDNSGSDFRERIREKLKHHINVLYSKGYKTFLCGMAEGFDLLCAEEVVEFKVNHDDVKLIAVVPFPAQARFFSEESKNIYKSVVNSSEEQIIICSAYRPDCFHRRNDFLVENSSVLLCFFNGRKGGTEYTVKKALRNGLRIINLC